MALRGEGSADSKQQRLVVRIATDFFLRSLEISSSLQGRDMVRTIVFMTILQANVAHLTYDQELAHRYAGVADMPPDSERRPITAHALAESLSVPYETMRRQVNRLVADGMCVRVGKQGVIVPSEVLARPEMLESLKRSYSNVQRMMQSLRKLGVAVPASAEAGE